MRIDLENRDPRQGAVRFFAIIAMLYNLGGGLLIGTGSSPRDWLIRGLAASGFLIALSMASTYGPASSWVRHGGVSAAFVIAAVGEFLTSDERATIGVIATLLVGSIPLFLGHTRPLANSRNAATRDLCK